MPAVKQIYLDNKYNVLRYTSYILYALGALSIAGAILAFILFMSQGTASPDDAAQNVYANALGGIMGTMALIGGLVTGLMMIVLAQLLNLFIDLEWNQRESIELQIQILEAMK